MRIGAPHDTIKIESVTYGALPVNCKGASASSSSCISQGLYQSRGKSRSQIPRYIRHDLFQSISFPEPRVVWRPQFFFFFSSLRL